MDPRRKITLGDMIESSCMTIIVVGYVGVYLFKANGKMILDSQKKVEKDEKKKKVIIKVGRRKYV